MMTNTLTTFITDLSNQVHLDSLIEEAAGLFQSNSDLDELKAYLTEKISYEPQKETALYHQYLVMAVASAMLGGIFDTSELKNYVVTQALDELAYMETFLRDRENISDKEYQHRLGMYLLAPIFFWSEYGRNLLETKRGSSQMRRLLDETPGVVHCGDCIGYSKQGWVNLSTGLPLPGDLCECLKNCRCLVEYR